MYKLKYLKYKKKYLNLKNNLKGGNNDLQQNNIFTAINNNDIDQVQDLINNNPNILDQVEQNQYNETPIFKVINYSNIPPSNIGKILIDFFISINPNIVHQTNTLGETPLFAAVKNYNIDIINKLIEKGANINVVNNEGNNIFFYLLNNLGNNFLDITHNYFLTSFTNSAIKLIDNFKDNYNNDYLKLINQKNNAKQNIFHVATSAITNDQNLNMNLDEEDINNNDHLAYRIQKYKYLIESLYENYTFDETTPAERINLLPSDLENKGYIGNFIKKIFVKLTQQKE